MHSIGTTTQCCSCSVFDDAYAYCLDGVVVVVSVVVMGVSSMNRSVLVVVVVVLGTSESK